MGLYNILQAVQADLLGNLVAPLSAVTFKSGWRELRANDAAPRIVWIRRTDQYLASQQGVRDLTRPRGLRINSTSVDAHVWTLPNAVTGDETDCETLANTLVASAYRVAHGAFEALGNEWPSGDDPRTAEWMTAGYLCIVSLRFLVPVTDSTNNFTTTTPSNGLPFDQSTAPPPHGTLQAPGDS